MTTPAGLPPQMVYPAPFAPEPASVTTGDDAEVDVDVPILVVGGGPVGMLQALLLDRLHDLSSMVVEREPTTTIYPKMEYTNGRSMEIYRKMGLHTELQAMAAQEVPATASNDELIVTSLVQGGKHVHTWTHLTAKEQREESHRVNDGTKYVEPHLRCHQILVEKWLKEKVVESPRIQSRWGTKFLGLRESSDHVISEVETSDGKKLRIRSQYVIGCDGGGSTVRKAIGLESKRDYLNMTVAFVHFRSKALAEFMPFPKFWHANVIGGGVLVSQNNFDLWTCHFMVPPDVDPSQMSVDDVIGSALGGCQGIVPISYDNVYCRGTWKADVAIANKFRSDSGRVFLAGDAAHQLSPLGGHGLNSGLGDVFDLAWKLAATIRGWGGEKLLTTYETERQQIAVENLGHVQHALKEVAVPIFFSPATYGADVINGEGENSEEIRKILAGHCEQGKWLHNQNGNILGYSYKNSPIILVTDEAGERPHAGDETYVPTTFPGSQTPRMWLDDKRNTSDLLSATAFNLVDLSEDASLSQSFVEAGNAVGVPLQVLKWAEHAALKKILEGDLILIRPDGHVAWRLTTTRQINVVEATTILRTVSGHVV